MWTRTPQPGLWFVGGAFSQARIYSRYVALQIDAIEAGQAGEGGGVGACAATPIFVLHPRLADGVSRCALPHQRSVLRFSPLGSRSRAHRMRGSLPMRASREDMPIASARPTPPPASGRREVSNSAFSPRHSRPSVLPTSSSAPFNQEGAGNAGCRLAPAVSCANSAEDTHTSIQVQPEQPGIPCAMGLRLIPCSPWRRIPLASIAGGLKALRNPVGFRKTSAGLTPATGARTTRLCRPRPRRSSARRLRS